MRKTRKDKARELAGLLSRGPALSPLTFGGSDSGRAPDIVAMEACKRWLDSWVAPLVVDLVPEMRPTVLALADATSAHVLVINAYTGPFVSTHRQGRLSGQLSAQQITDRLLVAPVTDPDGGEKVTRQWEFTVDGTFCSIWDYRGARWSYTTGPALSWSPCFLAT